MTNHHDLALALADAIFDRIETDGTLIKQNLAETIEKELTFRLKEPTPQPVPSTKLNEFKRNPFVQEWIASMNRKAVERRDELFKIMTTPVVHRYSLGVDVASGSDQTVAARVNGDGTITPVKASELYKGPFDV
jgi:hypothetical protein